MHTLRLNCISFRSPTRRTGASCAASPPAWSTMAPSTPRATQSSSQVHQRHQAVRLWQLPRLHARPRLQATTPQVRHQSTARPQRVQLQQVVRAVRAAVMGPWQAKAPQVQAQVQVVVQLAAGDCPPRHPYPHPPTHPTCATTSCRTATASASHSASSRTSHMTLCSCAWPATR